MVNPLLARGNFYGETLKKRYAGGFSLSETRYTPGSTLPYHSHESHYFGFVLSGTYTENYEQKVRDCRPSMIVYHPAGESHAQYFDNTAVRLFRIELSQARLRSLIHTSIKPGRSGYRSSLAVGIAHKLYKEFREPDAVSRLAIEGLGLELIAEIARDSHRRGNTSRQPPQWLRQAHELIKSRFLEHLTLADVAGAVGVHVVTLARQFHLQYGCTIGEMVRRERIGFARRQLLRSEGSLADIATAAGFYDQSHFARTFKKLTGITPAEYRFSYRQR